MIIFMNGRHTFVEADANEPIVWVDSSDASTYTLSGNDVLTLDNKGSLGGVMTLNGSVKFANSGFESWSSSDFIRFFIGETFMTDNSFTMVTTFDFQNIAQQNNRGWWGNLYADNNNRIIHNRDSSNIQSTSISSSNVNINAVNYQLGVQTLIASYDITTNTMQLMNFDASNLILNSISFNNVVNSVIWLLRAGATSTTSAGANNPLHEFRLYDKAFTLTEMQDLQTELNIKYAKPIVWVDSSDATTYTLSGADVLTLDNKGSLGGAMTLNGTVKFANDGFESWSNSDYITRDLGEPFLTNNSFTIVTTFECSDLTSTSEKWFSTLRADNNNRMPFQFTNPNFRFRGVSSGVISDTNANFPLGYSSNVTTIITTYDLSLNSITTISLNGSSSFTWNSITFNNSLNSVIYLMALDPSIYGSSMGANNPLHEFRLYDRAFTLTEMQNLQTELNNKYTP